MWAAGLAAAFALPPIASATDYPVADTNDLTQAALAADTDGDSNTSFTLTQNVTTPAGTVLNVVTHPVTLDLETSSFTLNLDGTGTAWNTGSYTYFGIDGLAGTDALSISGGAQVQVANFLSFNTGGLRITGSGSSLAIGGDFAVGRSGDAAINLGNGATLNTNRSFVGEGPGTTLASSITALVDGPGTVWSSDNYFAAGGAVSSVDVTVSNGGTIEVPHSISDSAIGRNGTASLLVTGPGSRFVMGGSDGFSIGEFAWATGHGTVTIRNGGLVSSPSVFMGVGDVASSGALTVDTGGVLATAQLARDVGSATVNFDNGTLRALADSSPGAPLISGFVPGSFTLGSGGMFVDSNGFDVNAASAMSGIGGLAKEGAGMLTLSAANTYGGSTAVVQGTLQAGIAHAFSAASAHTVAAGATLDTAGLDQTVASLDNAGTVTLLGSAPGSTLTVNGSYAGHNGLLKLGTTLGDSSSISDRLVLSGAGAAASGNTTVQIVNLGGLGALTSGNGIEVISAVNGATTTAQTTRSAFSLANGHVDAGAYEYRLYAADASGAGENWYLRSNVPVAPPDAGGATPPPPATTPALTVPAYRAEVPLLAALPAQLRESSLAMLGNLHQRVGDEMDGGRHQAWGRVIGIDRTIRQGGTVSPASEGRLTGFQAGTDLWADSRWRTGVYAGQLDGQMSVTGFASGIAHLAVGRNDLRSQYLGAYGTYSSGSGFYVDAVLQAGRHRYDASPIGGLALRGDKGRSLLASVELGQSFQVTPGWSIEPELQLVHQHVGLGDTSIVGATVQQDSHDGWIARAGLRVKGDMSTRAGRLQPYARLNLYRSSTGADTTRFIGPAGATGIATAAGGTSTEAALGATLSLSASTSLYGEIGRLWSNGGDAETASDFNASLGVKMLW